MSVFKIRLSVLFILLFPLLIGLGFWQLSRYEQKLELESIYVSRESMPALRLDQVKKYKNTLYLPVKASGYFDNERYFLLDNQVYKGRAGFSVIMPFFTKSDGVILVNRGWVPMKTRDKLPKIKVDPVMYHLEGTIYRSLGELLLLKKDVWNKGWPKVIQGMDFDKASKALGKPVPAYLLNLNKDQPAALRIQMKKAVMPSEKHLGYALQWFTMAAVFLGLYLFHMSVKGK
ncbi:MAG: SURF1 family protein [Endozoicomonas sp. (ex Botrylloides leachii)]|nr:SURF1 family protein [Endozoicomonas sp. (ex Botrylloides leachii)]